MTNTITRAHFHSTLRHWRQRRKLSQLELAMSADVSQRHISWLETARSRPSRDMIIRLCQAMDVPLRERNHLLTTAGFAKLYSEKSLDEPSMAPVTNILTEMLKHHEPYPAFVLDRHWNIKMKNQAANKLFELINQGADKLWQAVEDHGDHNLALLSLHPQGLRQYITNWDEFINLFMRRLRKEAIDSADASVMHRYERLAKYVGDIPDDNISDELLPIISLQMRFGDAYLSLSSVISTFGTAQDITANELRIETFYPSDELTSHFFNQGPFTG